VLAHPRETPLEDPVAHFSWHVEIGQEQGRRSDEIGMLLHSTFGDRTSDIPNPDNRLIENGQGSGLVSYSIRETDILNEHSLVCPNVCESA
jgi:hypothetical protein